MNFNSFKYLIFLTIVVVIYYAIPQKFKRLFLLLSSSIFYLFFGIKAFLLLTLCSLVTYFCARLFEHNDQINKAFIYFGILFNIFLLCLFKIHSLFAAVGISFYVFRNCSYLFDVKNGRTHVEEDIVNFALFSTFFPYIIQGPIDKLHNMTSQFESEITFDWDNIRDGFNLIIWGMFKKVLIADNLSIVVNTVYENPSNYSSLELIVASFCYSALIYCDFSGYSDIALGSAKLLGINITNNFNAPYIAESIRDFWRRWHISLSNWLKEYIYIPLGGSKKGLLRQCANIVIVFFISGLWHGTGWNYIVWGMIHAVVQFIEIMWDKLRSKPERDNSFTKIIRIVITFLIINFSWIFFRANNIQNALFLIKKMTLLFQGNTGFHPSTMGLKTNILIICFISFAIVELYEIYSQKHSIKKSLNHTIWLRYAIYTVLIITILMFGYYGPSFNPMDFVYFQF